MTPQDVARDLLERLSIMPLPVPYKSKNPNRPGWEQERVTLEEIPRRFSGKRLNVGGMWGEPSDGVVDIDQDCPQARTAADVLLPTTGAVYGHEGNPHSHALYRCLDGTAPARTRRWKDIDGTTLIELRSTGAHSLMPGSVHPDGYPYVWEAAGEPAEVDGEELGRLVARGAAASILARHWPAEGGRHDAAGALAGGLARLGWPDADVLRFVEAVVRARCDDDPDDRLRFAAETLKNGRAGRATTGWKSLAQAVPGDVLARVLEWLGAPSSPQEPAPSPAEPRPTGSGSDQEDDTAAGGQTTPEPEPAPTVVTMADVETRPLLWAWRNYLPLGATTLIEGDPDEGKSLILMDLVARITTGRVLPDGSRGDVDGPRDVLLVCAEDALDTTVRPRLLAAGADLARVHVLSEVPEPIRRFKKGED